MGDFSRDTFKLTNAMHELLTGTTVSNPKHYVGIRLQQGVPILDSDWNELEDIRRHELELIVRDVIGDGVPGLGEGLSIAPVEADNDFAIMPGILIVDGWQVINTTIQTYSQLDRFFDENDNFLGIDLTEPSADRTDIVYLDVFEREVSGSSINDGDHRLINENIGLETAIRRERLWTVWVAEGVTDFDSLTLDEEGHKYYPLARLFRSASPRITGIMIEDLRRQGLTLADGIKTPMYLKRGEEVVDPTRFSNMLSELRNNLLTWQQNFLFPIIIDSVEILLCYQNALNHIYYLTTSAEVNSDTFNLENSDGLTILDKLVQAQLAMLDTIRLYGTGIPEDMATIDLYQDYLEGNTANNIPGIQPAIEQGDLLGAVKAQEALTTFLGLSTGDLPEGSVSVNLDRVDPATAVAAGISFEITYNIKSDLLVPETPEIFDLEAVVSDVRWAISMDLNQITLSPGETGQAVVTVTPAGDLNMGDFADINLIAKANRRPSIKSTQTAQRFTVGELPPGETFFFYSGSVPLVDGVLNIPSADIETETYEVLLTLVNTTNGAQTHVFSIDWELIWPDPLPSGIDPSQWIPATPQNIPEQTVSGADDTVYIPIRGPSLSGISQDISFTLHIVATLVKIDEVPVPDGKSCIIDLPITVVIT
jgi:hypothetical protein